MTEFTALPVEISAAVDRVARKRARKGDENDQLFARLEVLVDLADNLRAAESEVVERLREQPKKNTWEEIAKRTRRSVGAAWARYGKTENTTPETRLKHAADSQTRVMPKSLPGMSITEAQKETGYYRSAIYDCIARDPEGTWWVQIETPGKRGSVKRILKLDGLRNEIRRQPRPRS